MVHVDYGYDTFKGVSNIISLGCEKWKKKKKYKIKRVQVNANKFI